MNSFFRALRFAAFVLAGLLGNATFIATGPLNPPYAGGHERFAHAMFISFLAFVATTVVSAMTFAFSGLISRCIERRTASPICSALLALSLGSCFGVVAGDVAGDYRYEAAFWRASREVDREMAAVETEKGRIGEWPEATELQRRVNSAITEPGYSTVVEVHGDHVSIHLDSIGAPGGSWSTRQRTWVLDTP